MIKLLALLAFLIFTAPASAQSFAERMDMIERNNNAIMSEQAAQRGRIENLQVELAEVKADVKAIKEILSASGKKFVASTQDEWGRGSPASWSSTEQSAGTYSSSYASGGMRRGIFRGRLFGGRLLGGGSSGGG